jgi:hypothetical protein
MRIDIAAFLLITTGTAMLIVAAALDPAAHAASAGCAIVISLAMSAVLARRAARKLRAARASR